MLFAHTEWNILIRFKLLFIKKLIRDMTVFIRAGEQANFLTAQASAPDFFPKRLTLRLLVFFFPAAPTPAPRGEKKNGSRSWLLVKFGKILFSPQTGRVKLQKNKKIIIIVYLTIKTILPKEEEQKYRISLCFLSPAGLRSQLIF